MLHTESRGRAAFEIKTVRRDPVNIDVIPLDHGTVHKLFSNDAIQHQITFVAGHDSCLLDCMVPIRTGSREKARDSSHEN